MPKTKGDHPEPMIPMETPQRTFAKEYGFSVTYSLEPTISAEQWPSGKDGQNGKKSAGKGL